MSEFPKYKRSGKYEISNGQEIEGLDEAKRMQVKIDIADHKYTAVFQRGIQIGPESWDTEYVTKQLTPDTTIRELKEWYANQSRNVRSRMQLTISEEFE